jgi:TonB family protein
MNSATQESRKGWTGSVGVHVFAFLLLLLTRVEAPPSPPDIVEVSLGTISTIPGSDPLVGSSASLAEAAVSERPTAAIPAVTPVNPPERMPSFDEDVLPVSAGRKEESSFAAGSARREMSEAAHGQKEMGTARSAGGVSPEGATEGGGIGSSPLPSTGGRGSDVGRGVGYSVDWGDGGSRRLLSGDLPAYPEGAGVEAQIRLEAVVTPGGTIASVRPIQKADTRLEDAALSSVRRWVFEPLPKSVAPRNQTCLITFNYRLR